MNCLWKRFLLTSCLQALLPATGLLNAQNLSVHWEELTAADFVRAIQKSEATCVLPFGIIEKHGPQLPLGTDLINVRYVAEHATEKEYAVVFPAYYFGQIFEARQQPGTVAYSAQLQMELLQATTDEMGRNGCKKILILNGHGGNASFLPYFAQSQLASPHDYVVYVFTRGQMPPGRPALKTKTDMHAGESETAHTMISRPDLVHMDRATQESGADLHRLDLPEGVYTGIWWYARFPNHYAGDGSAASHELGQFDMNAWTEQAENVIRAIKSDQESLRLQNEFFENAKHPLETKQ
ncbi:MAG: creatininase family protein [Acidobacteriaceae bacterium]|nr:creatininase family protein [Acidobacteriaceae bacterium]